MRCFKKWEGLFIYLFRRENVSDSKLASECLQLIVSPSVCSCFSVSMTLTPRLICLLYQ